MPKSSCTLASAALVAAFASSAHAARPGEIIASESFVCDEGSIESRGGGAGWTGPWRTDAGSAKAFQIAAVLPANASSLAALGSALHVDGLDARLYRRIDLSPGSAAAKAGLVESAKTIFGTTEDALGKPGTTVWLGFVARGGAASSGAGVDKLAQVHLYHGVDTRRFAEGNGNKNGESLAIGRGNQNTDWNYESTCAHTVCGSGGTGGNFIAKGTPFNDDKARWVVLRFQFKADTAAVTLWLDPAPGAEPAESSATPLTRGQKTQTTWEIPAFHFDWVEVGGGPKAKADFDEIRLATTFTSLAAGASEIACGPRVEVPPDAPLPVPPEKTPDRAPKGTHTKDSFLHRLLHMRKRHLAMGAAFGMLVIGGIGFWLWRRKSRSATAR